MTASPPCFPAEALDSQLAPLCRAWHTPPRSSPLAGALPLCLPGAALQLLRTRVQHLKNSALAFSCSAVERLSQGWGAEICSAPTHSQEE